MPEIKRKEEKTSVKNVDDDRSKQILQNMSPYTADVLNPFLLDQKLSLLDILKSVLLTVTLLPLRLLLMLLIMVLAWVIGKSAMIGMAKNQVQGLEPITGWRRHYVKPFVVGLARFVFFVGGWYWIPRRGVPRAPRGDAPVLLVGPHSSFLDTVVVIALGCPGMVVKDTTEHTPLFGSLVKYTQPLFVRSEDPDSRRRIAEDIRIRVQSDMDWEQLLLFPEGGCGNRNALLQFKLGAFSPGVPVQPVFIRYRNRLDSITWTWDGPGALKQLWLTLTQFRIGCELEFLPVYRPSNFEKQNPRIFADNVQNYISSWTGTPVTRFCLEDARYVKKAKDLHLPPTAALVKLMRLRKTTGRDLMNLIQEVQFLSEKNRDVQEKRGDADEMSKYLGLDRCPEALRDFFRLLDQHENGSLDFRVYEAGLHLLRLDLKTTEKLKLAFQVFGSKNEAEHLEHILLLWKGVPSSLSKTSYDKIETEDPPSNGITVEA